MKIDAANLSHKELNDALRKDERRFTLTGCCGQRFIAAGMSDKDIAIEGIAGNALGAYLNGACLTVNANAQDAVGDTMNEGKIIVKGSIGDAAGYAMRGGKIFVRGNAGYRAGIHMKEYKGKIPVMIIGGTAGSFLGEYQGRRPYRRPRSRSERRQNRRIFSLHRDARGQNVPALRLQRYKIPGSGYGPAGRLERSGRIEALCVRILRSVRIRCERDIIRPIYGGDARQQKPVYTDVCGKLKRK